MQVIKKSFIQGKKKADTQQDTGAVQKILDENLREGATIDDIDKATNAQLRGIIKGLCLTLIKN